VALGEGTVSPVLVADAGGVRTLTLNNPRQRNALDLAMRERLAIELGAAMVEPSVRVVVLTGAQGTFCAGGDVSTMRRQSVDEARRRLGAAQAVTRAIVDGAKPVVAAVEGYAIGAGLGIAAACDRFVVAADARLSTSFTTIGLLGDLGVFWSLPRRVGAYRARQMLLMPTQLSGAEAFEIGLADRLSQPGLALDAAMMDARVLAAGPPLALAAAKAILNHGPSDLHAILDREVEDQAQLFATADFAEGLAALRERRAPRFDGR